jgi:hypothetical protein
VVSFERAEQETRIYFVDGNPVWCVSSRVQLQLEARLAAGGVLKMRDLEAALARQRAGAHRLPQTLIAELMATEASLEKDLRALSVDTLRDVATWTNGTFAVYDGVTPPPWAHTISADFPALLVEALRSQCTKETLQKEFVSRKGVLRIRSARSSPHLNEGERTILTLANGERTIEDLVKRSGIDELAALSAMHVLCALHLTDLLPPQRSSKSSEKNQAAVATPQLPPTPADPAAGDRGGATDRFVAQGGVDPKAAAGSPAEVTPKVPEPAVKTGESTAKLPALQSLGVPKAPNRTLRIANDDKTEDVALTAATFAIGRHPRNDLVLKDPRISSFHCRVELEGDRYALVDLKSRNGTLLNGSRIDRAILKNNDQIQLGSTKVSYLETPA